MRTQEGAARSGALASGRCSARPGPRGRARRSPHLRRQQHPGHTGRGPQRCVRCRGRRLHAARGDHGVELRRRRQHDHLQPGRRTLLDRRGGGRAADHHPSGHDQRLLAGRIVRQHACRGQQRRPADRAERDGDGRRRQRPDDCRAHDRARPGHQPLRGPRHPGQHRGRGLGDRRQLRRHERRRQRRPREQPGRSGVRSRHRAVRGRRHRRRDSARRSEPGFRKQRGLLPRHRALGLERQHDPGELRRHERRRHLAPRQRRRGDRTRRHRRRRLRQQPDWRCRCRCRQPVLRRPGRGHRRLYHFGGQRGAWQPHLRQRAAWGST